MNKSEEYPSMSTPGVLGAIILSSNSYWSFKAQIKSGGQIITFFFFSATYHHQQPLSCSRSIVLWLVRNEIRWEQDRTLSDEHAVSAGALVTLVVDLRRQSLKAIMKKNDIENLDTKNYRRSRWSERFGSQVNWGEWSNWKNSRSKCRFTRASNPRKRSKTRATRIRTRVLSITNKSR